MSLQKESEWEREFDRQFPDSRDVFGEDPYGSRRKAVKSFIRELLSNREKEIAEDVEKIRKEIDPYNSRGDVKGIGQIEVIEKVLSILKH